MAFAEYDSVCIFKTTGDKKNNKYSNLSNEHWDILKKNISFIVIKKQTN